MISGFTGYLRRTFLSDPGPDRTKQRDDQQDKLAL
jgi:hypothetical protein